MITRKPYNHRRSSPPVGPSKGEAPPTGVTLVPCWDCHGRGRHDQGFCHTCFGKGRVLWNPDWVNPTGPNPAAG